MARPGSSYAMISVAEALRTVLDNMGAGSLEQVPLADAAGRTLAEDVRASDDLPPFPASIKARGGGASLRHAPLTSPALRQPCSSHAPQDGYAVVSADGEGLFPVVGEARAGEPGELHLQPGQVAYITTGAPVPAGADAVVQVEDTQPHTAADGSSAVRICKAASAGQDIRPVGSDIGCAGAGRCVSSGAKSPEGRERQRAARDPASTDPHPCRRGDVVLSKGDLVGAAEIGILATIGAASVSVFRCAHLLPCLRPPHPVSDLQLKRPSSRQPVVAVFSTGDEVVDPGQTLAPGQIRDCNRPMLCAAAAQAGARVIDLGIAHDEVRCEPAPPDCQHHGACG